MRRGMMQSGGKKEPNIIFRGLGGSLLTKAELVEGISGAEAKNVTNWIDDGADLYVHINKKNLILNLFGSRRFPNSTRIKICDNITAIEDVNGLIVEIRNNTLFNTAALGNLVSLNLQGLKSIGNEGLRDVRKLIGFNAPKLEGFTGNESIYKAGLNNGDIHLDINIPLFGSIATKGEFRNTNFNIINKCPLVAGNINMTFSKFMTQFPFENATSFTEQCFRGCVNLEGEIRMENVTTSHSLFLVFNNIPKVTSIILPNVPKFTKTTNDLFGSFAAANLEEIDIRSCKEFINSVTLTDDRTSNLFIGLSALKRSQLTVHAHIDMKTYNSGSPQTSFADVIALGGTVNWWNNDGTFNSTN